MPCMTVYSGKQGAGCRVIAYCYRTARAAQAPSNRRERGLGEHLLAALPVFGPMGGTAFAASRTRPGRGFSSRTGVVVYV
jgi:hypothetical protein